MCKFRELKADEIDVRIGQASEKGVTLLLYKDARVDMNILDETLGALNWQREHYECKGNLFCRVGINRNYNKPELPPEWVWKSDCGTESNTEAEKGEASDSFKRACTNIGIGRELYTSPFIWVPAAKCNISQKGQKNACYDKFVVSKVKIEDHVITGLEIKNMTRNGEVVFTFGKVDAPKPTAAPKKEAPKAEAPAPKVSPEELELRRQWAKTYEVTEGPMRGSTIAWLFKNDRAKFDELRANPPSEECAAAIQILIDWIMEGR